MVSYSSRTAYVLLAAIEEDFRGLIDQYGGESNPHELFGDELAETAIERRTRAGHKSAVHHVSQLTTYLDFQDSYDLLMRLKEQLPRELVAGLRPLQPDVVRVVTIRNRVAHHRPLELDDLPKVLDLARDLASISGAEWSSIREVRDALSHDPGYVFQSSATLVTDPDRTVPNNLPNPDYDETSLLGRKEERRRIQRAILGSWPVVSILGDGGVGKTALALQVCYDLIQKENCPFDAVVWVTAKNSRLTSTEIVRIENTVEDSLGLFASASEAVGGDSDKSAAVENLIEVLGAFPTLLVLDNVETVLDENFPQLLREIPPGSKILITSRIGVKTEDPFEIKGLSTDDGKVLMRLVARARGYDLDALANDVDLATWVEQMNGHPAYIKWFMSGLQTGQSPDALLNDNGLVLDFCMSNVFDYLGNDSRNALKAMLVVPGSHTLAELSFLTDFDATRIQQVVHELTTTNFVTQVRGGPAGSALELSDFARKYLRRTLQIAGDDRQRYTEKQRQLYAVGGGIQAAHERDPYAADTIDVRGVGDYSAARHLRDALDLAGKGKYDEALVLCNEAANLAPGYYEASRVEAYIHELSANFGEASEAYSVAKDMAPNNPYVAFAFGSFLVHSGFDPIGGIRELQRAAKLNPESSHLHLSISDAHFNSNDPRAAMDAAHYAVQAADPLTDAKRDSVFVFMRACAYTIRQASDARDWNQLAEDYEVLISVTASEDPRDLLSEGLDLMLWAEELASPGVTDSADNYIAERISTFVSRSKDTRRRYDPAHLERRIGWVESVTDRGFGFIKHAGTRYFFHAKDCSDSRYFDDLNQGSLLAFMPAAAQGQQNPPAKEIYWVA